MDNIKYICKYCGKEFDSPYKLGGHIIRCKLNPKYEQNVKNCCNFNKSKSKSVNENQQLFCKYCGKECKNNNSLTNHEIRCKFNPNKIDMSGKNNPHYNCVGSNQFIYAIQHNLDKPIVSKETRQKISKVWKDKHLTEEHKLKQRIGAINYIKSCHNGQLKTRYNKKSISFINKLNEEFGWHLQHAENGGEVQVIGYFLDGYDKELNIAFEYDEQRHYKDVSQNILLDKDILRQQNIINELHCRFFRYNEKLDLLYEVINE